jgi:hypothetical protein
VIALLGEGDEIPIIDLNLRLRIGGETGHERAFLAPAGMVAGSIGGSVAHSSPGASCNRTDMKDALKLNLSVS